jgi:hypothetical protein
MINSQRAVVPFSSFMVWFERGRHAFFLFIWVLIIYGSRDWWWWWWWWWWWSKGNEHTERDMSMMDEVTRASHERQRSIVSQGILSLADDLGDGGVDGYRLGGCIQIYIYATFFESTREAVRPARVGIRIRVRRLGIAPPPAGQGERMNERQRQGTSGRNARGSGSTTSLHYHQRVIVMVN